MALFTDPMHGRHFRFLSFALLALPALLVADPKDCPALLKVMARKLPTHEIEQVKTLAALQSLSEFRRLFFDSTAEPEYLDEHLLSGGEGEAERLGQQIIGIELDAAASRLPESQDRIFALEIPQKEITKFNLEHAMEVAGISRTSDSEDTAEQERLFAHLKSNFQQDAVKLIEAAESTELRWLSFSDQLRMRTQTVDAILNLDSRTISEDDTRQLRRDRGFRNMSIFRWPSILVKAVLSGNPREVLKKNFAKTNVFTDLILIREPFRRFNRCNF